MIAWIRRYFDQLARRYPNPVAYYRARTVLVLSTGAFVLTAIVLAMALLTGGLGIRRATSLYTGLTIALITYGVTLFLADRGHILWARLLFVVLLYGFAVIILSITGTSTQTPLLVILATVAASLLFGRRGTWMGTSIGMLMLFAGAVLEVNGLTGTPSTEAPISSAIFGAVVLSATSLALWLYADNVQSILTGLQHRTEQLHIIARIGQSANAIVQSENLLSQLVELIREQMGFYHTQIFLVDETGTNAVLVASTGTAGERLLARGHSLPVGSRSVIGQVTQRGQPVYATDTSADPVHKANEFLPDTHSELALPLIEGETVIGALDVQSTQPNAFSKDDIETLQIMAAQISTIIRNARLFEQLQHGLEENRKLYEQAEANLREVERLNRQLTGQAWQDYLTARRTIGVQVEEASLRYDADWTPAMAQAVHDAQPVIRQEGGEAIIAVPIEVRGNIVGAIEMALPSEGLEREAQEMLQAVVSRLGLALDNSRLFEEAQTLAEMEHILNTIGGQLQSVSTVDDMLRIALTELREVMGAESASIRLRPAPSLAAEGNGQTRES